MEKGINWHQEELKTNMQISSVSMEDSDTKHKNCLVFIFS